MPAPQLIANRTASSTTTLQNVRPALTFLTDPKLSLTSHPSVQIALCGHLQPIPLPKTSICCSTAILQNSAVLLNAICFTGALHEAIARDVSTTPQRLFKHPTTTSSPQQDGFRHKALSLTLLNQLLTSTQSCISEATILAVTVLLVAEAISGDTSATAAHAKGLARVIEVYGGEEILAPAIGTLIRLADVKAATVTQAPPTYTLPGYLRRRFSQPESHMLLRNNERLPLLGSSFSTPNLSHRLSGGLKRCLNYIRHLILVAEQYSNNSNLATTYSIDDFVALEHHLLSPPQEEFLSKLENCIRLALLLYSNTALWKTPVYFGWVVVLRGALKEALLALNWEVEVRKSGRLLVWMLFLGGHAAIGQEGEEGAWWMERLRGLAVEWLGLRGWREVVGVLEGFLYVDLVSGRAWEGVWRVCMSGSVRREVVVVPKHLCERYT